MVQIMLVLEIIDPLTGMFLRMIPDSTNIVAITAVAVTILTAFYAWLTSRLVSETQKMRRVQTNPRVSVRVEMDHTGMSGYELVVRNEGQGPARNVRFAFNGDSSYFRNGVVGRAPPCVEELAIIKNGLDHLEAGQTFRFFLGTVTPQEFERASQSPWVFHTEYEDMYGKFLKDTYTVDFSFFSGMFFEPDRLEEISTALKDLQKDLHRLTEGHAKVHVVVQARDDFLEEQRAYLK